MSEADKTKWDAKYLKKPELLRPRDASAVVMQHSRKGEGLKALDLACGAGRNTIYLAQEGYKVDAVDIAKTALTALNADALQRGLAEQITLIDHDLDTFKITTKHYELIVMSNFLDRALIERAKEGLKEGGLFIVETYMVDDTNEKKGSTASNLLEKEELKMIFSKNFKIIHYDEFENEPHEIFRMRKQVIVAEKM